MTADKNLALIETELRFIRRAVAAMMTEDYEAQREVEMAVESALQAAFELKLEAQAGTTEEILACVAYPAVA